MTSGCIKQIEQVWIAAKEAMYFYTRLVMCLTEVKLRVAVAHPKRFEYIFGSVEINGEW